LETLATGLFTFCYLAFGPLLLLFCSFGLFSLRGLLYQCELTHVSGHTNNMDVAIVLGCTLFSALVTFFFSLYRAVEMAQSALRDEASIFYRLYFGQLVKKRRLRDQQRNREQQVPREEETQALIQELSVGDSEVYGSIREEEGL
jgi:hypothetical protein